MDPIAVRRHHRQAIARAVRVLRMLRHLDVEAKVVGSLSDGRFSISSDVDFLILSCPKELKYAIEGRIEYVMSTIPFDVVYREDARKVVLDEMECQMVDEHELLEAYHERSTSEDDEDH
jgi:hypothetical protein